ncbi:nitroreductase/quinone reductase family protein [Yinghuangia seranimata]|uniref:nitroreductase/quinone reductase family protein n=1 Tax=Yinghuangia seranimata TaxID=408067 RepID=UPI00248CCA41|nr:nitroreductase/quinone reductase family protein [Yinghuangia seranimata]MDI2130516.1 nitroreductase/quinone reductase family protein [Yinghuangia seranimata]
MTTTRAASSRTTHATRSETLRWEGTAWALVGAAWAVSAWPGFLIDWAGSPALPAAAGFALCALFAVWQSLAHGTPLGRVGERVLRVRPGRRRKSRAYVRGTVVVDTAVIGGSGVLWCVAAREFAWSETVTGGAAQVAAGVAFLAWGVLHIPAARRVRGGTADAPVVSRRVLGAGPMTVAPTGPEQTAALDAADAGHRKVRNGRLQRWVLNPPMRLVACSGALPHYAVLETTGRTTGRRRRTVVGVRRDPDSVLWLVAEHGSRAGYVRNLVADPHVRVHLRGRWRPGVAALVPDDDVAARLAAFPAHHARTLRRFATTPATVRVELAGAT